MKFSNRGKRKREVEKREKRGKEGGRRKTKLRKEILISEEERTNQRKTDKQFIKTRFQFPRC